MVDVIGFTANNINHPKIKEVKANVKKILKFEYPKTFKTKRSLLFLKFNKNHILEIKTINGSNLIIMLGIYKAVNVKGIIIEVSKFLKNSISSNRFNITPKQ